jgi:hypothetical protein
MAEVNDIYGNDVTGKVGTVSFYKLRGKTVMRSLPGKRKKPQSSEQVRNQNRFQEIRKFCTLFKHVVIPQIWNGVATTSSGYHLFMKTNSPAFNMDGALTDPQKVILSKGPLPFPAGMMVERNPLGSSTIQIKYEKKPVISGKSSKERLMVISSGEGKYSELKDTGITKWSLEGTFELPELDAPASQIYLFFESQDQRYYSDSICFEI